MRKIIVVLAWGMLAMPSWGQTQRLDSNYITRDGNIIKNYKMKTSGTKCLATFNFTNPRNGWSGDSIEEYEAVKQSDGSILCKNGRWSNSAGSGASRSDIIVIKGIPYRKD